MELNLKGRRALVTGGGRGIGRAIAEALASEGCNVAITARTQESVNATLASLRNWPVDALGMTVDASDAAAMIAYLEKVIRSFGGIDILVSNVSVAMSEPNTEGGWRKSLDADILSTVRCCEAAIPSLKESGVGSIIFIGTIGAIEIAGPRRPYAAVKSALLAYAKASALDLGQHNIRVNVVSPGPMDSTAWDDIQKNNPQKYAQTLQTIALRRLGAASEVANLVTFLASDRASLVTGANIICDGGMTRRV